MKKFWLILVSVLCLASVFGGKLYWNHKLNQVKAASSLQAQEDLSGSNTADADVSDNAIAKRIAKLPKTLRQAATEANKKSGQVRIILVGSDSEQLLALLLQKKLDDVYGESFFKVTAQDLGKANSLTLNKAKIKDLMQSVDGSPDLVVYTPLLYNDDRQVSTEDTETVVTLLSEKVKITYPKAAFLVSLPNYSSQKPYMNDRIDDLKTYVEKQKIDVLNYLSKWPKGAKRADVVGDDGQTMNTAGREIWIDYISNQWGLD